MNRRFPRATFRTEPGELDRVFAFSGDDETIARMVHVAPETVRHWRNGTEPVPHLVFDFLKLNLYVAVVLPMATADRAPELRRAARALFRVVLKSRFLQIYQRDKNRDVNLCLLLAMHRHDDMLHRNKSASLLRHRMPSWLTP